MEETKSFYTEEDPQAGTHAGWINDSSMAQEVANVENNQGRNAAIALEKSLETTGMNPIEKENTDFVDLFLEEYPHLFREEIDEKTGERYIATSQSIFFEKMYPKYPFLPAGDPYSVLNKFRDQMKETEQNGWFMKKFHNPNLVIIFSKHGRFITSKTKESPMNEQNNPPCNYNPNDTNWRDMRDLEEDDLKELLKGFALYQAIGEEFDRQTEMNAKKRLSIDAIREEVQHYKQEIAGELEGE